MAPRPDVEQTGLERQCHGKPREHIVGRVEQGVADALGVAERAAHQGEERPTRVLADDQDQSGNGAKRNHETRGRDQQGG